MSNIPAFKIVLLGESSVGKTSIASTFTGSSFNEKIESTIGAAYFTIVREIDNKQRRVEIWDTAGQERYHSLAPMYYRGAKGALVVFDITNENSFERAKKWVIELVKVAKVDIVITLVGNKSDLKKNRQVQYETADNYAKTNNLTYFETSAKNNSNIDLIFDETVKLIPEPEPEGIKIRRTNGHVSISRKPVIVKSKCC